MYKHMSLELSIVEKLFSTTIIGTLKLNLMRLLAKDIPVYLHGPLSAFSERLDLEISSRKSRDDT